LVGYVVDVPVATPVYLEDGRTWTFTCAFEWPGWARRGKGPDAALENLAAYRRRYAAVAGRSFRPGPFEVIGQIDGDATTDFGAPGAIGEWESDPWTAQESQRQTGLLAACWRRFDAVVEGAPAQLRKGPRGGGRDRDAIADHVREAERGYAPKLGARIPKHTPWPEQRDTILAAIRDGAPGAKWPARYSVRRLAWHVLDHAWEIEDRSESS
jgi:hypothetical protein